MFAKYVSTSQNPQPNEPITGSSQTLTIRLNVLIVYNTSKAVVAHLPNIANWFLEDLNVVCVPSVFFAQRFCDSQEMQHENFN